MDLNSKSVLKNLILLLVLIFNLKLQAQEGFWPIEVLPEEFKNGSKLFEQKKSKRDSILYYPDLLRASVSLDNGNCSGAIISKNGLLLTNYHCVEPYLLALEKEGKINLDKGYFLGQEKEGPELQGLSVDIPIGSFDLKNRDQKEIEAWISRKQSPIRKRISLDYFPSEFQTMGLIFDQFQKITMVACPPRELAKAGGEEGNWSWPRYSADFCLLRIEKTDPFHNRDYRNFPMFEIAEGLEESKVSMIIGYPFSSHRNAYSRKIINLLEHDQGTRLKLRNKRLNIYQDYLDFNPDTRLPMALMIQLENERTFQEMEIKNVNSAGLVEIKKKKESELAQKDKLLKSWFEEAGRNFDSLEYYNTVRIYLNEGLTAPRVFLFVFGFSPLLDGLRNNDSKEQISKISSQIQQKADNYFETNDPRLEKELFFKMVFQFYEDIPEDLQGPGFEKIRHDYNGDVFAFVEDSWGRSIFSKREKVSSFLSNPSVSVLTNDPLYSWVNEVITHYFVTVAPKIKNFQAELSQTELKILSKTQKSSYPEANGTLRISKGKIVGYQKNETDYSQAFCTVSGMNNAIRFKDKNLKNWLSGLNPGQRVTFLSSVEATSGNSGSPMINEDGELIGLAFDQNQQGLGNRFFYNSLNQRCIGIPFQWIEQIVRDLGKMPEFFDQEFNQ